MMMTMMMMMMMMKMMMKMMMMMMATMVMFKGDHDHWVWPTDTSLHYGQGDYKTTTHSSLPPQHCTHPVDAIIASDRGQ